MAGETGAIINKWIKMTWSWIFVISQAVSFSAAALVPNHDMVFLDMYNVPQKLIEIPSKLTPASSRTNFRALNVHSGNPYYPNNNHRWTITDNNRWNLSLILQFMQCQSDDRLVITSQSRPISVSWCSNTSSSSRQLSLSGSDHFRLETRGSWIDSRAEVLVAIYRDTNQNCDCEEELCCRNQCHISDGKNWDSPPRCISKKMTNVRSFLSDNCGFPNCNDAPAEDEMILLGSQNKNIDWNLSQVNDSSTTEEGDPEPKISIYVIIIASLGGAFAFGFIIIFFSVYLYRRNTDWKIQRETLQPQISVLAMEHSDADNISIDSTQLSGAYYSVAAIQRMSQDWGTGPLADEDDNRRVSRKKP